MKAQAMGHLWGQKYILIHMYVYSSGQEGKGRKGKGQERMNGSGNRRDREKQAGKWASRQVGR